ncbi:hypothetical protein TrRE_jg2590 [Triparma retinervis]|uniref:ADP,ATP carrier protein n=1 Tax=Triparma retinervis TaxID=2557542 RepID=A0A9W7KSZ6_9STRA|nr:hypothetical protein TrRE_jg2590 [Triparma retinervis]
MPQATSLPPLLPPLPLAILRNLPPHTPAALTGTLALFSITMANYMLGPMRDASAMVVGVEHIPKMTFLSTLLALFSSVPVGWLFEAPDPKRRKIFSRFGMTRGETQGSSLALFYRLFEACLVFFAVLFALHSYFLPNGKQPLILHVLFYLSIHVMKLHSVSLIWGVTTEAMEYEETADGERLAGPSPAGSGPNETPSSRASLGGRTRLKALGFVGFGGTVGSILGSLVCARFSKNLRFEGLLLSSAALLEVGARLAIRIGGIMRYHWTRAKKVRSSDCLDRLASKDSSLKRSDSSNSMKRIGSGNSLSTLNNYNNQDQDGRGASTTRPPSPLPPLAPAEADTFKARLLRGVTTILNSRLLIMIFTYNALFASSTTLLSFQRASLVANRPSGAAGGAEGHTEFLAKVNIVSSLAVLLMQASGMGAKVAAKAGTRGTLMTLPVVRLGGVTALLWWYRASGGTPPSLAIFLALDEFTRVVNLAVAKPVRESLWRGLSNEARYEAKPLVDTLANRWGGGSAAFLVSAANAAIGKEADVGGFPHTLVLTLMVVAWWAGAAFNLGLVRRNIDDELKKIM